MKKWLHSATAIALVLGVGPALAGKSDNTLNVAFTVEPTTMDTYHETTREGNILARLLYDGLIEKDQETGEFVPSIASSFTVVDDKTLDFEIRDDVRFHNGELLTADDVVYTLNLVSSPDYGARYQIAVSWIDRVEKTGDNSVRIHMKRPYPLALEMLAGNLPVYPEAYYEQVGPDGMANAPIGAGPFRLVDSTPGSRYVFERFDDYYSGSPKGQPQVARIVARILPEMNTQYAELLSGGLDWAWRVPPDDAERLNGQGGLQTSGTEILRFAFAQMNPNVDGGDSPLKDVRVRQAISHAVNREAIRAAFVGGSSQVAHAPCSHLQFGCTYDVTRYDFDAEAAKRLLAEAGYPDGFATSITIAATPREQVEAIAANLEAIGIRATLNFQQYAPALTAWRAGEVPILIGNWGSYGVSDVGLSISPYFSGTEDDMWRNPEVMQLLAEADTSMDRALRLANYEKAVRIITDEAYVLPLWTFNVFTASSEDLEFTFSADEYARFYTARWK